MCVPYSMELTVLNILLGTNLIVAGLALLMGYKWVNLRNFDPKVAGKRLKQYLEYIEELEYDNKKLKGFVSNSRRTPQIEANLDMLNSDDGISNFITELLPKIIPSLPKPLQALASDPNVINYALKLYKENPERAKAILGQFISKGKKGKSEPNTDDYGIPGFNQGSTV